MQLICHRLVALFINPKCVIEHKNNSTVLNAFSRGAEGKKMSNIFL